MTRRDDGVVVTIAMGKQTTKKGGVRGCVHFWYSKGKKKKEEVNF